VRTNDEAKEEQWIFKIEKSPYILCRENFGNGDTAASSPFKSHFFIIITNQSATVLSANETMLSCAPIEISSNDPVGFGADEHMKYLNATLSY
jgi:hypothetical protein